LVSLLVADRLQQTFSGTCLRHVLTVEASTKDSWLDYVKLAEVADTFQANQTNWRMGQVGCSGPAGGYQSKPKLQINYVPQKSTIDRSTSVSGANAQSGIIASVRSCYKCKSPDHLMRERPKRNAGRVMTPSSDRFPNKPRYNAKAYCTAIAVDPVAGGHVTQEVTLNTDKARVKKDIAVVNRCLNESTQSNDLLYVDHSTASSDLSRSNECLFDPGYVNVDKCS
jgi:hypothetical protein